LNTLLLTPNFHCGEEPSKVSTEAGDRFYDMLIEAHRTLSEQESHAFNARLILILSNHIGDLEVLGEALKAADVSHTAKR
jgi:hypothetical protein